MPRNRSPSLRRASLHLVRALLALVALLCTTTAAHAAVPMCSEDGRTIAAPPIMRPSDGRVLEDPLACERLRSLLTSSHPIDERGGQSAQLTDAPLRAVPTRALTPRSPRVERLGVEQVGLRTGITLTSGLFRPPRSV